MKKILLLVFVCPFVLFAADILPYGIQHIIYDPNISQDQIADSNFSSSFSFGYNLYRAHISLAYGDSYLTISSNEYTNLIFLLKDASSYNVLDVLEFEKDKHTVLSKYLSFLDLSLLNTNIAIANLKEEMSVANYTMQSCLNQKIISDKQYSDSIEYNYQNDLLEESLISSKKYAQCASDARIEYNSKKILVDKLTLYYGIVTLKYNYLSTYKDDIVSNFDLIKQDSLERLLIIKRLIEKYDL